MTKIQMTKMCFEFLILNFEFVCNLVLGAWDLIRN